MKKLYIFIIAIVLLVGTFAVFPFSDEGENSQGNGIDITTFKSASCGCCGIWAKYAKKEGFSVDVKVLPSMDTKKTELGIPSELSSCHTSLIEGYVVEGHVPVEAINKLLEERPDIKGIALPGMPSGTPGMPGPKTSDWTIYSMHNDGSKSVFMVI